VAVWKQPDHLAGNGREPPPRIADMRVDANGKSYQVSRGTTVTSFIKERELDPRFVVVELNGEPLERARYGEVELSEGDRLELVRAVAGG
jgi:sulfur carrier protein